MMVFSSALCSGNFAVQPDEIASVTELAIELGSIKGVQRLSCVCPEAIRVNARYLPDPRYFIDIDTMMREVAGLSFLHPIARCFFDGMYAESACNVVLAYLKKSISAHIDPGKMKSPLGHAILQVISSQLFLRASFGKSVEELTNAVPTAHGVRNFAVATKPHMAVATSPILAGFRLPGECQMFEPSLLNGKETDANGHSMQHLSIHTPDPYEAFCTIKRNTVNPLGALVSVHRTQPMTLACNLMFDAPSTAALERAILHGDTSANHLPPGASKNRHLRTCLPPT